MDDLAPGIRRWTAPHPEWRPKAEEVESYALTIGGTLLLVDPLLPAADDPRAEQVLADLDRLAGAAERLDIAITIPYHTRSAEALWQRYGTDVPTAIWGNARVRLRLQPDTPLQVVPMGATGTAAPIAGGAAAAYVIGRPRRTEHPVYVAALRALAFGDAVVGAKDGLRFWNQSSSTGAAWYRNVFAPTLAPLAELDVDRVLVTHGPPVVLDGRRALAECLAADPVPMY